jgi:hypothetical protein
MPAPSTCPHVPSPARCRGMARKPSQLMVVCRWILVVIFAACVVAGMVRIIFTDASVAETIGSLVAIAIGLAIPFGLTFVTRVA